MKRLFFCCNYESEFFGSLNYRCNVNGGVGLDGNLLLLVLLDGYYENSID